MTACDMWLSRILETLVRKLNYVAFDEMVTKDA